MGIQRCWIMSFPNNLFSVPCPSRLARLRAPPSLSLLSLSSFFSSACDERISWEDDFRAGMDVRVLFEGENRITAEEKKEHTRHKQREKERLGRQKEQEEKIIGGDLGKMTIILVELILAQWKSGAAIPKLAVKLLDFWNALWRFHKCPPSYPRCTSQAEHEMKSSPVNSLRRDLGMVISKAKSSK